MWALELEKKISKWPLDVGNAKEVDALKEFGYMSDWQDIVEALFTITLYNF